MRILGIDPGGTTGWALVEVKPFLSQTNVADIKLRRWAQPGGPDGHKHHAELAADIHLAAPDLILLERFEHRNNEFAELISLEYIGVVEEVTQRHKIPLVYQGSSQAKKWATNVKLRRLELLISPIVVNKHANDALRHVVYYLCAYPGAPVTVHQIRINLLRMLK